ncbi:hypothetical protein FGIG_06221 [Fasciola gigantica]|uniref:Uncharacterized protein n=1 Tax=Fasciola gigantica TaxID=46835 RepID=A0A504Z444_FASGI|nr:hypothetical protein FGIG_06221 [Fasciola gigantica]
MSQAEPQRRSASNRPTDLSPVLNVTSSSDLCEEDQLDVGKCGDADLQQPRCDGEGYFVGDRHWRPLADMVDDSVPAKLESQIESNGIVEPSANSDRHTSADFRSPEPMFLVEPPKLRRALAYLEFDDGDCEPDESTKLFNCHLCDPTKYCLCDQTMRLGQKSKMTGQISDGSTGRWRTRVYRVFKENIFHKLTKREPSVHATNTDEGDSSTREAFSSSDPNEPSDTRARHHQVVDECTNKHRPQQDLFHQFTVNDLKIDSGSSKPQSHPVRNKSS